MRFISIRNRIALMLMVVSLLLSISLGAFAQLHEKKILMIIPLKDFWDMELTKLKEIFEQNGLVVTIASSVMKEAEGIFGTKINPDIVLNRVRASLYDAIIFLGGEGAVQYWDDPLAHPLVKEALKEGKVWG